MDRFRKLPFRRGSAVAIAALIFLSSGRFFHESASAAARRDPMEEMRERQKLQEQQLQESLQNGEQRATAPKTLLQLIKNDDAAEGAEVEPATPSIFDGNWEYIFLGGLLVLVVGLTAQVLLRHKRDAEIRALSGKYLADGIEAARFEMPAIFAPRPQRSQTNFDRADEDELREAVADEVVKQSLVEFYADAPARVAEMCTRLTEFGKAFDEAARKKSLLELCEIISGLKAKADNWDLRPAWQMSSALELLVKMLLEKGKEVTPSTVRTVASAVDVLQELCVPGVRPDLIIAPPISVLAVDDDPLCLRAVVFALQKAEMTPDVAADGENAVALSNTRAFDVIFMDIQMPGINGLEACAQIHQTKKNADTPVIFVTVRSDFQTRAESTLKGGSDLIAKPFLMFEITVKALTYAMRKRPCSVENI